MACLSHAIGERCADGCQVERRLAQVVPPRGEERPVVYGEENRRPQANIACDHFDDCRIPGRVLGLHLGLPRFIVATVGLRPLASPRNRRTPPLLEPTHLSLLTSRTELGWRGCLPLATGGSLATGRRA